MKLNDMFALQPSREEMERAFMGKDAAYDGLFYVAVKTTGIFCRPSCPSQPQLSNVEFFGSIADAFGAGYRPCKRCRPLEANGVPPAWVAELISMVESSPEAHPKAGDLRELGITPERARRWFQQNFGMSFSAWCRGHRLAGAFTSLRQGQSLDNVALDSGFESLSGFRDAFARAIGEAPGRGRQGAAPLLTTLLPSPVGPLLAGASDDGLRILEFVDARLLEHNLTSLRRQFDCPILPGQHPLLDQLRSQLTEYFEGGRRDFTLRLAPAGTPFQQKVWQELRHIPYAQTISYDELARRIGQPTAQRAVARANGANRICILIPCHRVIGKDGTLTGYGGGLWRKRLLLELERTGALPGHQAKLDTPRSLHAGPS